MIKLIMLVSVMFCPGRYIFLTIRPVDRLYNLSPDDDELVDVTPQSLLV